MSDASFHGFAVFCRIETNRQQDFIAPKFGRCNFLIHEYTTFVKCVKVCAKTLGLQPGTSKSIHFNVPIGDI
jgi:hypothetical protein